MILMNFIDGERIDKIKVGEYESYAKQVVKFGLTTLLIHGVVHGDLHSGNIIFIKDDNDKPVSIFDCAPGKTFSHRFITFSILSFSGSKSISVACSCLK